MTSVTADHEWDHRLKITGKVVDANGDPARFVTAEIDCETNATDTSICGHNQGRSASTGMSGTFELDLHIHAANEGLPIVLDIDGQKFEMSVNLAGDDGEADESDRFLEIDYTLDHEVDNMMLFASVAGAILFILLLILFFVKRRGRAKDAFSSTTHKSLSLGGKAGSEDLIGCPRCDARLKPTNLKNHLMKKHYLKADEADSLLEKD